MKGIIHLLSLFMALSLFTMCQKDDSGSTEGTVKDTDGNVYHTVTIGTQVWMVENLKTTKYRNGDAIQKVTDDEDWINLTTGAYCNYDNNEAIGEKYGRLYNWWVISDEREIAPEGWRLPTEEDWETLISFAEANIGNSLNECKALASKTDWKYSDDIEDIGNNLSINNSSGFTALPGGWRTLDTDTYNTSRYTGMGSGCLWWGYCDKENKTTTTCYFGDSSWGSTIDPDKFNESDFQEAGVRKTDGEYVRCIKEN